LQEENGCSILRPKHRKEGYSMGRREADVNEMEEQLAEAKAQIDALQSSAADAEARAATLREKVSRMESELAEARSASEAARTELAEARAELERANSQLRAAVLRYREVRLAGAPEIPAEMVPEAATLEEIDSHLESAGRMAERLRERLRAEQPSARLPLGAPSRRPPDLSSLSPAEKIREGLRDRARREAR